MSEEGWVKLFRCTLDNPIVCKDSDYFAVWCYLLLKATHQEQDKVFNGERITLKNGQLLTGRKAISKQFNIDESKVQRILKTFESEQQIEQQTGNRNRLISIVKWEMYQQTEQQNEQQLNNRCTTTEQQLNTNKNLRIKELKNKDIYTPENEIFDYWNSKTGVVKNREGSFDQNKISTAVKKYSKEIILKAIDRLNNAVLDANYYYDFKWNLYKFLKQANGISNWLDDGQLWNDYSGASNKGTGENKKPKVKQTGFTNYEQRNYDYDKFEELERQRND